MAEAAALAELRTQLPIAIQRGRDSEARLRGLLLGQVSAEFLLLCGSDEALLEAGERIVVRTLQAGKALGFETTVREVIAKPVPLYFVDLPGAVEVIKLRKSDRLDLFVPADLRCSAGEGDTGDTLLLKGNMVDVSAGGCRVFTKRSIPAGTVVTLSFTLPGERHDCVVAGSVIDCTTQSAIYGLRVRFFPADKNRESLAEIKRWVNQHAVFADVT